MTAELRSAEKIIKASAERTAVEFVLMLRISRLI